MTALRSFLSERISSCSASNCTTSSSVYSNVLTRCSSSKSVDMTQDSGLRTQHYDRRSQQSIIPKVFHPLELPQQGLHIRTLHADAAAVNQPHLLETASARFGEVLQRHVAHFVGTERMKVERVSDRDLNRAFIHGPRILCDTL